MDDQDLIYGEMFDALDLFAVTYASELTGRTDILKYFAETKAQNVLYKSIGNKQSTPITGSAKEKAASRDSFETKTLNISRPLAGHFFDNGKLELFDQVTCKPAMLKNLRAGELVSRGENLLIICAANPQALTACNILPIQITEYTAAKVLFASLNIIPHDKIKTRAGYRKELKKIRKTILGIIENKLTNAMYAFEGVNDVLLSAYLNVIKLVHTGVRHNQPTIPTTVKSFQMYSLTTNEKILRGVLQVLEMPKTNYSRVDGSYRGLLIPLGSCTIQVMAFGFEVYSKVHVITNDNEDVIEIRMTPIV